MHEFFRTGTDTYDTAVLGLKKLAIAQRRLATLQKQTDVFVFRTEATQTTFTACLEIQMQFGGPFGLGFDSIVNHQHQIASSQLRCFKSEQGACQQCSL